MCSNSAASTLWKSSMSSRAHGAARGGAGFGRQRRRCRAPTRAPPGRPGPIATTRSTRPTAQAARRGRSARRSRAAARHGADRRVAGARPRRRPAPAIPPALSFSPTLEIARRPSRGRSLKTASTAPPAGTQCPVIAVAIGTDERAMARIDAEEIVPESGGCLRDRARAAQARRDPRRTCQSRLTARGARAPAAGAVSMAAVSARMSAGSKRIDRWTRESQLVHFQHAS